MTKIKRDPKKVALAKAIIDAYQPESVEDMNDAFKDLFGPLFESMIQGERWIIISAMKPMTKVQKVHLIAETDIVKPQI